MPFTGRAYPFPRGQAPGVLQNTRGLANLRLGASSSP